MTSFTKKSFTVYPGSVSSCVKEARDCLNYEAGCGSCVRVQGRFTNYMTAARQLKEWQTSNLKLAKERNAGTKRR